MKRSGSGVTSGLFGPRASSVRAARSGRTERRGSPAADRYGGRARRAALLLSSAAFVSSAAAFSMSALAAFRLTSPPSSRRVLPVTVVPPVMPRSVRLTGRGADLPGRWGVASEDAYAQVGPVVWRHADGSVSRRTIFSFGRELPCGKAALERAAFPADIVSCASEFPELSSVAVESGFGELPLWTIPARPDAAQGHARAMAFLGVHGRGMSPSEWLRAARSCSVNGLTWFSASYRNDRDAPADPDGLMHLGSRESDDVWLALGEVSRQGFSSVVLAGVSLGGAVVANLLSRHASLVDGRLMLQLPSGLRDEQGWLLPDAGRQIEVSGLLLEAAALDWPEVVALVATGMRMPRSLARPTVALARLRARLDPKALRPISDLDRLLSSGPPMLVVHGDADMVVPVAISDRLVASAPGAAYLRLGGVGHAAGFNMAHQRYFAAMSALLSEARAHTDG